MHSTSHLLSLPPQSNLERVQVNAVHHHSHHHHHHGLVHHQQQQQQLQAVGPHSHVAAIVHHAQPHFVLATPHVPPHPPPSASSTPSATTPSASVSLPPPPASSSFASRPTFSRPPPPIQSVLPQPQQPQHQARAMERWAANTPTVVSVGNNVTQNKGNNKEDFDDNKSQGNVETVVAVKQKTPMCLVNELARYNRIRPEYRLLSESGPAHNRSFSISLKLSEDEAFLALGPSIKKAQHAAAAIALERTKFKHPPAKEKQQRGMSENRHIACNGTMTPTVELNALAMKRGEQASYTFVELASNSVNHHRAQSSSMPSHLQTTNQSHSKVIAEEARRDDFVHSSGPSRSTYTVLLRVGHRAFYGEGLTPQKAKHDAAAKAINAIKAEEAVIKCDNDQNQTVGDVVSSRQSVSLNPASLPFVPSAKAMAAVSTSGTSSLSISTVINDNDEHQGAAVTLEDSLKSPVSLVHEVALKRRLECSFTVIKECGAAHMRHFTTKCCVGDIVTQGEGNGKRASKRRAAELMLECLSHLPPLVLASPSSTKVSKRRVTSSRGSRRRSRGSQQVVRCEEQLSLLNNNDDMNPISRLIQLQQAKRAKEPVYTLTAENGTPRRKEYTIQVEVEGYKASGSGPNKKLAKRAAADSLLNLMGFAKALPEPEKPVIVNKRNGSESQQDDSSGLKKEKSGRKLKFEDEVRKERRAVPIVSANGISCQLKEELTHKSTEDTTLQNCRYDGQVFFPFAISREFGKKRTPIVSAAYAHDDDEDDDEDKINVGGRNKSDEEERRAETTTTDNGLVVTNGKEEHANGFVSAKDQLEYLAKVLHVTLKYQEFLKKGEQKDELFCLLSISTKPPQVFHGVGATSVESQELASEAALLALAGSGINCFEDSKDFDSPRFAHNENNDDLDNKDEDNEKGKKHEKKGKRKVLIAKVASTSRTHSQI